MMKSGEGVALTRYGCCESAGCRSPLFAELARCGDPACINNRLCFECVELFEDVARELCAERNHGGRRCSERCGIPAGGIGCR